MIATIGCRLNQADSALISGRLEKAGYEVLPDAQTNRSPAIFILNTCAVTASASQKSRQALAAIRRKYPDALTVVCGCSSVVEKEDWETNPNADIVIGNNEKKDICELIARLKDGVEFGERKAAFPQQSSSFREKIVSSYPTRCRAFLKIQEGCNSNCSYCIVPLARGPERSRDRIEIEEEFHALLEKGFKEIVLSGVNIFAYRDGKKNICDLLSELASRNGDFRLRLGSTEPGPEALDIIPVIAENSKICRFLHVPIQHGCDEILRLMRRRHASSDFAKFAELASEKIPGIHIGTDIIVGFPDESDELFRRSKDFIASLPIANLHIFRFSPRKGTDAANFTGRVPERTAKERASELASLENELSTRFLNSQIGAELEVLIEKPGLCASGWSDNYIRVVSDGHFCGKNVFVKMRTKAPAASGEPLLGTISKP